MNLNEGINMVLDNKTILTDNIIPVDIRNLFPIINESYTPELIINKLHIEQYLEKTEELYRLNLISSKQSINDVNQIIKLDDVNLRGLAWACLAGIYTFNGNYKKAYIGFNMALDLPVTDDIRSYIFTELSNLLRKLGYSRESISLLQYAESITENEKLVWRIKTYIGLCYKTIDPKYSLTLLSNAIGHYTKTNNFYQLTNIIRHTAEIYINEENFIMANRKLDEAMRLSVENSVSGYEIDIFNDRGWLFIAKKHYDEARKLYIDLTNRNLTPYQMSLALQNLGYLEFECHNYREAIHYHSQSLQITKRYEMLDMAFEDFYKLGLSYEKLSENSLADHFYSEGFKLLKKEMDLGIKVGGYRRELLDAYVNFLQNNQRPPSLNPFKESFSFAVDKPMKETRDTFHKSLLTLHMKRTKNAPELCKFLKIDTRTYFLYQKRLGLKRGDYNDSIFSNQHFKQYIDSLLSFSWKEANQQFEEDLFQFLLNNYQHNKKKISEILKVSYQQVVQKTKVLQ